jgi:hypothetical protein
MIFDLLFNVFTSETKVETSFEINKILFDYFYFHKAQHLFVANFNTDKINKLYRF